MVLDHSAIDPSPVTFELVRGFLSHDGKTIYRTKEEAIAGERRRVLLEYAAEVKQKNSQEGKIGPRYEEEYASIVFAARNFDVIYKVLLDKGLI